MRVPIFRRILETEFPGVSWIGKLLIPINLFLQEVRNGLAGDITFTENIACQIQEFSFTTASDYVASQTFDFLEFKRKIKTKAIGMVLLNIAQADTVLPITSATSLQWMDVGNGQLRVYYIAGLSDSTTYNVRVLVI